MMAGRLGVGQSDSSSSQSPSLYWHVTLVPTDFVVNAGSIALCRLATFELNGTPVRMSRPPLLTCHCSPK